jgi:hypothetical protein
MVTATIGIDFCQTCQASLRCERFGRRIETSEVLTANVSTMSHATSPPSHFGRQDLAS